jgi:hypothetical protein
MPPVRISWSRLRDFEECSERAHLLRAGHRSSAKNIRNFFPGTVVDRCMRTYLDADTQERGAMAAVVDTIMDREEQAAKDTGDGVIKWRNATDRDKVRADCIECVTKLEPILEQLVVPFEWQAAWRFEVPFTISGRPVLLIGELDLLVRKPDGIRVLDLKMTRDGTYWTKTFPQLCFYELAVFGSLGEWPVRSGLIQPLCDNPVLAFAFTDAHRRELLGRVTRFAEAIFAGQHAPAPSFKPCDDCVVRHACPRFKASGNRATIRAAGPVPAA